MPFIAPVIPTTPNPTPPVAPTHQQLLASYIQNLVKAPVQLAFQNNAHVFSAVYHAIYNNPQFNCKEILEGLGTDGLTLLIIAQAFGQAINTTQAKLDPANPIAVPATAPEGVTITPNANESLSVVDNRATQTNVTP